MTKKKKTDDKKRTPKSKSSETSASETPPKATLKPPRPRDYGSQVRSLPLETETQTGAPRSERIPTSEARQVIAKARAAYGDPEHTQQLPDSFEEWMKGLRSAQAKRPRPQSQALQSQYWSAVEHKALADQIYDTLLGRSTVDNRSVLLQRKTPAPLGTPVKLAEMTPATDKESWKTLLIREREQMLALHFDPTAAVWQSPENPDSILSYGDVVALAGDFYGDADQLRLQMNSKIAQDIRQVLPNTPSDLPVTLHIPRQFVSLALDNIDHFVPYSWIRYTREHCRALRCAAQRRLKDALFYNAFADHFLTDSFAAGHLRTPRLTLSKHGEGLLKGGVHSYQMHEEDNEHGLWAENLLGYVFFASGDGEVFNNRIHYVLTAVALSRSIQRIYHAYQLEGNHRVQLLTAIEQTEKSLPPLDYSGEYPKSPAALPELLDTGPGLALPSIRELLPVPLLPRESAVSGELWNYPPLFTPDAKKRLSKVVYSTFNKLTAAKQ